MNAYVNEIAVSMFSSFDGGNRPSRGTNPERFYHGFVLGLLVGLDDRKYEQILLDHGVEKERIRKYGFAFEGKKVLIG